MKKYILFFFILFFLIHLQSCASGTESLRLGVIGDPHYLSEQLMDDGKAVKDYVNMSGKDIRDVPLVLQQVLDDYLKSDIDILLIPGDITKDGEKQSHIDFRKKLQPLIDKGVRIYVIPGNHDINIPHPVKYEGDKTLPTENISPQEFAEIYADCGYTEQISRDTASLSYVAELDKKTWLLAIDACKYQDYKENSISSGRILPETEKWITEVLAEARKQNIRVLGMMHHGLVEHIMTQSYFFKDYLVDDWSRLADLLADQGMKAIFTGHFHANDITEYKSPAGNKIYDIETGSLAAFAYPYRFVELTENGMSVSTKNVTAIEGKPDLAEDNKKVMQSRARALALEVIRAKGMSFPPQTLDLLADLASQIFVQHLQGDEKVDDAMKEAIAHLIKDMGMPVPLSPENIELDFYPADNNVEITF